MLSEDRYVHLTGIVVRQPRAGWITLEVPPLDSWERPMRWLTREQRQRVESSDFYRLLQEQIGRRYLALAKPAG